MTMCRNGLHEIRGPQDLRPLNGECVRCSRIRQRDYTARCRAARRRLQELGL
jgi:hypothetical protein